MWNLDRAVDSSNDRDIVLDRSHMAVSWCLAAHDFSSQLAAIVAYAMKYLISPYLGDVARYVRADPIATSPCGAAIRERGLKLLQDIHDSGEYRARHLRRAPVSAQVVAYDVISLFWTTRRNAAMVQEERNRRSIDCARWKSRHMSSAATDANRMSKRLAFREAQRALRLAPSRRRRWDGPDARAGRRMVDFRSGNAWLSSHSCGVPARPRRCRSAPKNRTLPVPDQLATISAAV